jgi:hypothetical protein
MVNDRRLRIVVFEDGPGLWVARGLEHDLTAEARSLTDAVRAVVRLVESHSAFDLRHNRSPLSAFRSAPQPYWSAFNAGTRISWACETPARWDVLVAVAHGRPYDNRLPWPLYVAVTAQ